MPIRSNIARAANRVAGQAPALSPDSKVVIFIRHVGKQDVCLSPTDTASIDDDRVMLLDLATAQPTQIATNSEASGCLSLAEPRFADATTAIVSAYGLGLATIHNLSVCVVDIPGHAIRLLGRRTTCALPIPLPCARHPPSLPTSIPHSRSPTPFLNTTCIPTPHPPCAQTRYCAPL